MVVWRWVCVSGLHNPPGDAMTCDAARYTKKYCLCYSLIVGTHCWFLPVPYSLENSQQKKKSTSTIKCSSTAIFFLSSFCSIDGSLCNAPPHHLDVVFKTKKCPIFSSSALLYFNNKILLVRQLCECFKFDKWIGRAGCNILSLR